jgi:hypothetical protein
MITYKVTCKYPMAEPFVTLKEVFPDFNGEPAEYCERFIIVSFESQTTVVNLGPEYTIETITP